MPFKVTYNLRHILLEFKIYVCLHMWPALPSPSMLHVYCYEQLCLKILYTKVFRKIAHETALSTLKIP